MSNLVDYIVAREHQGDRLTDDGAEVHRFEEGETRTADPAIVANLVKMGVLVAPAEKAEAAPADDKSEGDSPANKAEPKAPSNKGAKSADTKGK